MSMSDIDYDELGSGMGGGGSMTPAKKAKTLLHMSAKYSRAMREELDRRGVTPNDQDIAYIVDFLGEYLKKWHVLDEIEDKTKNRN